MITTTCFVCGVDKKVIESRLKDRNYCSLECWRSTFPEKIPCIMCGIRVSKTPSAMRKAPRTYCSHTCMGEHRKTLMLGKDNPFWKGGRDSEAQRTRRTAEYREWRSKVLERDGFKCQVCEEVGGELHAHHIKAFADYPELRLDPNNGITLCHSCHKDLHPWMK